MVQRTPSATSSTSSRQDLRSSPRRERALCHRPGFMGPFKGMDGGTDEEVTGKSMGMRRDASDECVCVRVCVCLCVCARVITITSAHRPKDSWVIARKVKLPVSVLKHAILSD